MLRSGMAGIFITAALGLSLALPAPRAEEAIKAGSIVKITGKRGSWVLTVNGKPFYIKGVVCGLAAGKGGEDYLKLAREAGANTVRTLGTDQGTQAYFDAALKYGLMVNAGIRFDHASDEGQISYIDDSEYKKEKINEIMEYVNKFKDHPALFMWNLGDEAIFLTKSEQERAALSRFLEEMVRLVHGLDPDHPVIYASADISDIPYIEKYVPGLDAFGMNVYGSIKAAHAKWYKSSLNIPYIITEYGPAGPWAVQKDRNGVSSDQPDWVKAAAYRNMTKEIMNFKGYNLGGFAFHIGEASPDSLTWWNLNYEALKRASFWEIYKIYTGGKPYNKPPRITKFNLSKVNNIAPGEIIGISAEAVDTDSNPLDYTFAVSTAPEGISRHYVNEEAPVSFTCEGINFKMTAPVEKGLYRVYAFVNDGYGNAAAANRSIKVE